MIKVYTHDELINDLGVDKIEYSGTSKNYQLYIYLKGKMVMNRYSFDDNINCLLGYVTRNDDNLFIELVQNKKWCFADEILSKHIDIIKLIHLP
jgi:hypothetical protein